MAQAEKTSTTRRSLIAGAGMPIHDLTDIGQGPIGHHRPVLVLNLVEQPHDIHSGGWRRSAERVRLIFATS